MFNVEIKKLQAEQIGYLKALILVFERVFKRKAFLMPPENHLQALLKRTDFIVFVAVTDGLVVGGITAYILQQYYAIMPLAYIYDLAVENTYQRNGIGRRLMQAVIQYGKENGIEEVFVQAEAADEDALKFYKACSGVSQPVVHFTYPLSQNNGF